MFIKLYLIALSIFLGIDMVWLLFVAKQFYAKHLGYLMSSTPNLIAAFLFYLLFIVGLVLFVITPAIDNNSILQAALLGALFGLVTYATYDLTNLATIKDWPLLITIVDLAWGTVLSMSVSVLTYIVAVRMGL
jgi:uncharacterized membrane protein